MTDWAAYARGFATRDRDAELLGRWMLRLERVAGREPADLPGGPWLDAGAGIGRFSAALAERWRRPVVAMDAHAPMLREMRPADGVARLVGDALAPPVRPRSCAGVWAHLLLHQVADWPAAVHALAGCVAPGGLLAVRTFDPEGDGTDHLDACFPGLGDRARRRWPDLETVRAAMGAAGLETRFARYADDRIEPVASFTRKVEAKAFSSLHALSDEEFAAGLARVHARFPTGHPPLAHVDCTLLVVGLA